MSRVGSKIITVPDNVKVFIENGAVHAEGPKGKLSTVINNGIDVNINEKVLADGYSCGSGDNFVDKEIEMQVDVVDLSLIHI